MQTNLPIPSFEDLNFLNTAYHNLRIEKAPEPKRWRTPRKIFDHHFCIGYPTPLSNPQIVALSEDAFDLIGLKFSYDQKNADFLIGKKVNPTSQPMSHAYCGHQFGNFAGQLGDGRAMLLGDVEWNGKKTELQFKGSGLTPFSRTADGNAVLRSSIREFLCSEFMHYLGVPTTRALSQVVSSDTCKRDLKYDGNVIDEKCTVVVRAAESFIRFGSFELCLGESNTGAKAPNAGKDTPMISELLDFTLKNYYSDIHNQNAGNLKQGYIDMMAEIMTRTAKMVAMWQVYGFVHGVMNTDNMSINGLTIDYGPFGFMEHFDEYYIPNGSDEWGRYGWKPQPAMAEWDLKKLYVGIQKTVGPETYAKILENHNKLYWDTYKNFYYGMMAEKLGFVAPEIAGKPEFRELVNHFFYNAMNYCRTDMTLGFKALEKFNLTNSKDVIERLVALSPPKENLMVSYQPKDNFLKGRGWQQKVQVIQMTWHNPMAIESMLGYFPTEYFQNIMDNVEILRKLEKQDEATIRNEIFTAKWEEWFESYSQLLKSDQESWLGANAGKGKKDWDAARLGSMKAVNPHFMLRNWLIQDAIAPAENGDYSEVRKLLDLSKHAFSDEMFLDPATGEYRPELAKYCAVQPPASKACVLSCSS